VFGPQAKEFRLQRPMMLEIVVYRTSASGGCQEEKMIRFSPSTIHPRAP